MGINFFAKSFAPVVDDDTAVFFLAVPFRSASLAPPSPILSILSADWLR